MSVLYWLGALPKEQCNIKQGNKEAFLIKYELNFQGLQFGYNKQTPNNQFDIPFL